MIIGLLLLILVAIVVAVLGIAFTGGPSHSITAFGQHLATLNGPELFALGIAVGLVFCLGFWMLGVASRRRRATRADLRAARRQAAEAAQQRDELAARLNEPAVTAPRPEHYAAPVEPTDRYADGTGTVDAGRHVAR